MEPTEANTIKAGKFLEGLENLHHAKIPDQIDYLVEFFQKLFDDGDFNTANAIFDGVSVERCHPWVLRLFLATTYPFKPELPKRADFVERVKQYLGDKFTPLALQQFMKRIE